jgi:dTDP-4-dehydrorhamnose reductase
MWLIIGGDSEIGSITYRQLLADGQAVVATTRRPQRVAFDRPLLDLANPLDDWEPPTGTRASCVFAAIARLEACHHDPSTSEHINVTQTKTLIDRLVARDIYVLFLSTNQVFNGETPHVAANAPTCPVSEYGRQKACTEAYLCNHMARGAPGAILRLGKVVAPNMQLLQNWSQNLLTGKPIRAFFDMQLAPTPMALVVKAISNLMREKQTGIFQLTGPRDVSYAQVGYYLAQRLGAPRSLVQLVSARSAGLPVGATPRHTTLETACLRDRYSFAVPDPWTIIDDIVSVNMEATAQR